MKGEGGDDGPIGLRGVHGNKGLRGDIEYGLVFYIAYKINLFIPSTNGALIKIDIDRDMGPPGAPGVDGSIAPHGTKGAKGDTGSTGPEGHPGLKGTADRYFV